MKSFYQTYGKRIFDLAVSFLIIFLVFPLFIIIAFIIKIYNHGPIIFKQKRVGKNSKIFIMYKFRTMIVGADKNKNKYLKLNEADGPVFKIKNDPRYVNGFSRFLASSGLDELPQVLNVLRGEMSWVGPRPLPLDEEKKINSDFRKIRQSILPGITSSWVISGSHNLSFKKWMELDNNYSKKITFFKDVLILGKTFFLSLKMVLEAS